MPILMCASMVRQTIARVKTQTRRVVKGVSAEEYPVLWGMDDKVDHFVATFADAPYPEVIGRIDAVCPYGQPGDRLWIKETFYQWGKWVKDGKTKTGKVCWRFKANGKKVCYAADVELAGKTARETVGWHKRPAIFMPRWASRLTLEITGVEVQRVQDIGKDGRKAHDVLAEGITDAQIEHWRKWLHPDDAPAHTFAVLWDSINGEKHPWKYNCWVWVISFKLVPTLTNVQSSTAII